MGVSMGVHMPALAGQVALGQDGRVVARRRQALRRRATSWRRRVRPAVRRARGRVAGRSDATGDARSVGTPLSGRPAVAVPEPSHRTRRGVTPPDVR